MKKLFKLFFEITLGLVVVAGASFATVFIIQKRKMLQQTERTLDDSVIVRTVRSGNTTYKVFIYGPQRMYVRNYSLDSIKEKGCN